MIISIEIRRLLTDTTNKSYDSEKV